MEVKKILHSVDISEWSWTRKVESRGTSTAQWYVLKDTDDYVYFGEYDKTLYIIGYKCFEKCHCICNFTFNKKTKKFYGNPLKGLKPQPFLFIVKSLDMDWLTPLLEECPDLLGSILSSNIMKSLLLHKITSQEGLLKAIVKRRGLDMSFKTFRRYCKIKAKHYLPPLEDMISTVTNMDKALDIIEFGEGPMMTIFMDSIVSAHKLQKKVNPFWSYKRMLNEHNTDNDILNIVGMDLEDLDKPFYQPSHEMLVLRRPVYNEETLQSIPTIVPSGYIDALKILTMPYIPFGSDVTDDLCTIHIIDSPLLLSYYAHRFHNCSYSYKSHLYSHHYMIIVVETDTEEAMVGISCWNGRPAIEQIFGVRNSLVSDKMKQLSDKIFNKYYSTFAEILEV